MSEGYVALATGPRKYVDQAINLAASIKVVDPARRVCLVHDRGADMPEDIGRYFDDFAVLEDDATYRPIMNKLRLYDHSPYEKSMFVDSDCILTRNDVSHYWRQCAGAPFAITGEVMTDGRWKGHAVRDLMQRYEAHHIVKMNSGLFYFEKGAAGEAFFGFLNEFYRKHKEDLIALDGPWKYEDEPFFGVTMGILQIPPALQSDDRGNTIMATTWRAPICLANPEKGLSVLYKPTGFWHDIPVLPRGFKRLSPTFMHFIGLKPRRLYDRLSHRMRHLALTQ
jgi:hypothetical protein